MKRCKKCHSPLSLLKDVLICLKCGEAEQRKYRPKFQWPLKDKDYGDESLK